MLVKQVKKGRLTIEEAAEDAAMSVEELLPEVEAYQSFICKRLDLFYLTLQNS